LLYLEMISHIQECKQVVIELEQCIGFMLKYVYFYRLFMHRFSRKTWIWVFLHMPRKSILKN